MASFHSAGQAMEVAGEEKTPEALFSTGSCIVQYHPTRQGTPTGAIVARQLMGATKCSLD